MASRKLPFGYQIQQGRIEVHPGELETLQWIFCRYVEGSSYKKIAVLLQERGVSYVPGKPWNKNMVARILADERYIGTDGYPKLIDEKLFRSVGDTLSSRASPIQKSPACTAVQWLAVCGTCGERVLRDSRQHGKERWQCPKCKSITTQATDEKLVAETSDMLNQLIAHPDIVEWLDTETSEAEDTIQSAEDAFRETLAVPSFDEAAAKSKALSLAAAQFDALGSEDYETMRIQHLLDRAEPSTELDTTLLRQITSAILISPTGEVSLKLKNKQIVERIEFP